MDTTHHPEPDLRDLWYQGALRPLPRPECIRLLGAVQTGRVAYNHPDGPVVVPVNHVMHGADILFRTSPDTALGQHLVAGPVSFQVDDVDAFNQSGWSVLVHGTASYADEADLPEYLSERPVPWAAGDRTVYIRIRPTLVTGRRLLAS